MLSDGSGADAAAVQLFTQHQVDAGQLHYEYQSTVSTAAHPQWSWLTVNGSDADQWPRQLDSFQLSVTTRGAQPLSHQSVGYLFIYLFIYSLI